MMPTIASSSSPPQRPPPGDADLQDLYDQVLSAFAEESSPSSFSPAYSINRPNNVDHDPPYSPHSDEGLGSHISSRHHPQSRGRFSLSPSPLLLLSYLSFQLPPVPETTTVPFPPQQPFPPHLPWARALVPYQDSLAHPLPLTPLTCPSPTPSRITTSPPLPPLVQCPAPSSA